MISVSYMTCVNDTERYLMIVMDKRLDKIDVKYISKYIIY